MPLMRSVGILITLFGSLWSVQGCTVPPLQHRGGIMVDNWAEVKADDKTVAGIMAAFIHAEEALEAGNVAELMPLYSDQYSYHGLTRPDLQKVWEDLVAHHREFRSNHILSRIVPVSGDPLSAEVTCTGSLWAISKDTGEQVNIDSWYGEVHHMHYENGAWRVLGHRGAAPKTPAFGAAPHPFF